MTNHSTKRKFLASTLTATMVAAAVAPVAGAAAADKGPFPDVPADHAYAGVIADMAKAGIVAGGTDGNFSLGGKITRAEAAQMVAGLLDLQTGEEGNTTKFEDVKHNAWYTGAINSLVEEGIVAGKTSTLFAPGADITRGELAQLLVVAYGLEDVNVDDVELPFTDVDEKAWFAKPIKILYSEGLIKGQTATKFGPKDDMKRGDFAWLAANIDYAHGDKLPKPEITVQSVDVVDATSITVTLSDGSVHTVELEEALKPNVETEVTFTINEVEYTATVTWEVEVVEPAVESVNAINSKQLEVKFNSQVGVGASTATNYAVRDVVSGAVNTVAHVEVKADGKTAVITLTNAYRVSTDVAVSIDGIYVGDSIKETFPKFSKVVTIHDTVAPSIVSVTASTNTNAAQVATVKFSEPIAATPVPVFKVNGNVVTATQVTPVAGDGSEFTLTGLNLAVDKIHTLEVIGFEDGAENDVAIATTTFSVTKDSTQAKGKAQVIQDNKVAITFDKAMNLASLSNVDILRYNAASKEYVPVTIASTTLDSTGKIATFTIAGSEENNFFGLNDSKEDLIVKVKSGVLDSVGNQVTTFEEKVVSTQDVTGPALNSLTYTKNSKNEVEKFFFQFDEELLAVPTATNFLAAVSVTDAATNGSVTNTDLFGTSLANADITLAADRKTVVVELQGANAASVTNKLENGTYNFTIAKDLVKDASFAENGNAKTTQSVNFGAVANQVVVSNVAINASGDVDNVATVTFSKAVTAASAKNPANYSINGKALPADTTIVVTDTTANFTLPAGTVAKSDASAVLTINNIKAQDSSATFKNYVSTINALDNTAPVATGTVLSNGVIQLTFSEAVTITSADFENVKLNGKVLDLNGSNPTDLTLATPTLADGTQTVTIAVVPKVEADYNNSGFTYQYIDVDGDDNFDATKDIVLQQVKAPTAPAAWSTTISDLNLLTSVEVLTAATTATKDGSTYQATGAAAAGNLLKASDVIKVK